MACFIQATLYAARFAELREIILKVNSFEKAQNLALELHALTHPAKSSASPTPMYEDTIWESLTEADFKAAPLEKSFPMAWHIWHITRIEDLVGNILIDGGAQVFNAAWQERIKTGPTDTGNAMNADEARAFSESIAVDDLKDYRLAVARQSREIIRRLTPGDMRKKPSPENMVHLQAEGGLTEQKQSIWLRDFWGQKTFGGLILLPLTRHQLMHLEACEEMKALLQPA
jgi:hypothetical protein